MSEKLVLFKAGEVPCQGQYSSIDSIALQNGQWAKATNIRLDDATMRIRPPATELKNATAQDWNGSAFVSFTYDTANDNILGAIHIPEIPQDLIAVWDNSASAVKIFSRVNSPDEWREITTAGTRFTTNAPVTFTKVLEGIHLDDTTTVHATSIIVQNGYETPRIFAKAVGDTIYTKSAEEYNHTAAKYDAPDPSKCTATPTGSGAYTVRTRDASHLSTSSGAVTASIETLTGIGTYVSMTFSTSAVTNSSAYVNFSSGMPYTTAEPISQIQIIYKSSQVDIWDKIAIGWNLSGTPRYIHYPVLTSPILSDVGGGYTCAAFDCTVLYGSSSGTDQYPITNVVGSGLLPATLGFRWIGSASPLTNTRLDLYGVLGTGAVPFGTQFASSYWGSGDRQESASVVHKSLLPVTLAQAGGTPIPNIRYGTSEGFTYTYMLKVGGGGSSKSRYNVIFWADETGDGVFTRASSRPASGSENAGSGSISTFQFCARTGFTGTYLIYSLPGYDEVAPSGLHTPIPCGAVSSFSGDRLFVSGDFSTGNSGKVYFSQKSYPFRFSEFIDVLDGQFDSLSSGAFKLDSRVRAIVPMSASVLGADPIVVMTENAVYGADGITSTSLASPRIIAPHGTLSPRSVVPCEGDLYWLDNERQARSLGGIIGGTGLNKVEDVFKGIPGTSLADVEGFAFRNRIYFAYKGSGAAGNTAAMVYDKRQNTWVQDVLSGSLQFKRFVKRRVSSADVMGFVGADMKIYEYEGTQTGTEAGSNISVDLWSRSISNSYLTSIRFSEPTVYADRIPSTEWDFSLRSHWLSTSTAPGKIDMDTDPSGNAWTVGRGTTESDRVGLFDCAVQLRISGTAPGGARIYSITIDREEMGDRQSRR
jgi:hypothetical protein